MSMDLTGITNQNEYYTNHYFSSIFEENAADTISKWREEARNSQETRTPWALLREAAQKYYPIHNRFLSSRYDIQTLMNIQTLADTYLAALGYPEANPEWVVLDDETRVPVYLELKKPNGAPALWVLLASSEEKDAAILEKSCFSADAIGDDAQSSVQKGQLTEISNEELVTKILFGQSEPPRFVILIGMNQIALIDRNKWNEKRFLQFELEDIFSRREETTLQAMAVLLHRESLCPEEGAVLLDELDANSQKHAAGVSQDLKYALRESIELLGNEVLYDLQTRKGVSPESVDAGELTLECLRYMYRMLFVLFIEARKELGYAPVNTQAYLTGYSLESLRDIADNIRDDIAEVGGGYYLHETLSKLYDLIYNGYPKTEEELREYTEAESIHDMFVIAPLKAHIFDPEYTKMITEAKLRNRVMLRIIDLMSLTRETGRRNDRRGRISYANLGINQLGSVYEALLSYRGFIAEHTLFEVKRAGDSFNELDVGYFVAEEELNQYTEDERVRYEKDDPDGRYKKGDLRRYEKGSFIYRLAGREREKSASYYTPEVLTKCLVKYALKELLEGKTADEILHLTVCEPAMGSAAFLNEAINQLAEAYLDRKQKELGEMIPAEDRLQELQKVKMYIADRNVYGIDLNPVAVELAEVSLWLNTIYKGGFVPWFGTQLVNGNSLIGARRQCYRIENLQATTKGLRWYENAPDRVLMSEKRMPRKQIYHFLLGDPGMCSYSDKVIKSLEPDNIKKMAQWNKAFTAPYSDDEIATLLRLSSVIDSLWDDQVKLRQQVENATRDSLSVYGYQDTERSSHTTIRQKDKILSEIYKSKHMRNAGPYARLKFAMDYWCALWFWPIEKADLLPSRSEFFFDLSLILEGTMGSVMGTANELASGQMALDGFDFDEAEQLALDIAETYQFTSGTEVDIPALRQKSSRLNLAAEIAEQNHFMHWELEFADLFKDKGGFDLMLGNPPWIRLEWDEQAVLSDEKPLFVVRNLASTETLKHREDVLISKKAKKGYFAEYEGVAGNQYFLNAAQNYYELVGMKANLYKCFLPQAWKFCNSYGVSAFLHPDGVFDDPRGNKLREQLYPRLRKHFQFTNEYKLFAEVDHHTGFSINIYNNNPSNSFEIICNLFSANTIEQCYDTSIVGEIPGLKDANGEWNLNGHPGRIVHIGKKELCLFAKLFDESNDWKSARLPIVHAEVALNVMEKIGEYNNTLASKKLVSMSTVMWDETKSQNDGITIKTCQFPETNIDTIYSGPHIGLANPIFKASRRVCEKNSDYDNVDLIAIGPDYIQRFKYSPACSSHDYIIKSPGKGQYIQTYRVAMREMLNLSGERSLIPAIIPPGCGHIITVFGMQLNDNVLFEVSGILASLISDFYIKAVGRGHCQMPIISSLPCFGGEIGIAIAVRSALLNCLNSRYSDLWAKEYNRGFNQQAWAKPDKRLDSNKTFSKLTGKWSWESPLRSDFERRQALVEIDVLTAIALGIKLEQLKNIYHIQFPVLQSYEADTWYDAKGRIVFTNNRSLTNVGFTRPEWENGIKGAPAGQKFYRTIMDDTMPGGPIERTIEYVAPFDRCDREQDYEMAWKYFEEKYGGRDAE